MFTLTQWAIMGVGLAWLVSALMEYFEPHASAGFSGSDRLLVCAVAGILWACVAVIAIGGFTWLGLLWATQ